MSKPELRAGRGILAELTHAKLLRRRGQNDEAEVFLLALIERTEREADGGPTEHWFYEHLAVLYHERGDHASEAGTLERYAAQAPASPRMAAMMARRLETVRNENQARSSPS